MTILNEDNIGTIKPKDDFDPSQVVLAFQKALGYVVDKQAIIDLLVSHSLAQRMEVIDMYKVTYDKDLILELKQNLSGSFMEGVVSMLSWPADLLVVGLGDALKVDCKDDRKLVELLCGWPVHVVETLSWLYERKFESTFEDALDSEYDDDCKMLMKILFSLERDKDETVNMLKAQQDAQELHNSGLDSNDGADFINILMTRSYQQIQATLLMYEQTSETSMKAAIEDAFPEEKQYELMTFVHRLMDSRDFFATRAKYYLDCTHDSNLILRLLAIHSELDLADIKSCYKELFGIEMYDDIKENAPKDLKNLLLAIVGK